VVNAIRTEWFIGSQDTSNDDSKGGGAMSKQADKQEIEYLKERIIKLQAHNDLLSRRLRNLAMMLLEEKIDD